LGFLGWQAMAVPLEYGIRRPLRRFFDSVYPTREAPLGTYRRIYREYQITEEKYIKKLQEMGYPDEVVKMIVLDDRIRRGKERIRGLERDKRGLLKLAGRIAREPESPEREEHLKQILELYREVRTRIREVEREMIAPIRVEPRPKFKPSLGLVVPPEMKVGVVTPEVVKFEELTSKVFDWLRPYLEKATPEQKAELVAMHMAMAREMKKVPMEKWDAVVAEWKGKIEARLRDFKLVVPPKPVPPIKPPPKPVEIPEEYRPSVEARIKKIVAGWGYTLETIYTWYWVDKEKGVFRANFTTLDAAGVRRWHWVVSVI